ncbi:MAG: T9SS type A sorting domain-containing protein [Bacteroidales bacterium]|nr:T9SS type A sorting domain-containing protein [Bacteroidales bacterium]
MCITFNLFSQPALSQSTPVNKLDSTITYNFSAGGDSILAAKTITSYTPDSLVKNTTSYIYDATANLWLYRTTDTNYYNSSKQNTKCINYTWNSGTSAWVPSSKSENTYIDGKEINVYSNYNSSLSSWVYSARSIQVIDYELGKQFYMENYSWNNTDQKWIGTRKQITVYSESGEKVGDTTYTWNSTSDNWNNEMTINTIINADESYTNTYKWDDVELQWKLFSQSRSTYYTDGTNRFAEDLFCFWNSTSSAWDSVYKNVRYVYGFSHQIESYLYVTHYPSMISEWMQTDKSDLFFDENNRIDSIMTFIYNTNNDLWDTSSVAKFEFNEDGKYTLFRSKSKYDADKRIFMDGRLMVYEYDNNGNILLNEDYKFDGANQKWVGSQKSVYNPGPPQFNELFIWDNINDTWIGIYAFDVYRNDEGDAKYSTQFIWNAELGDWENDSRQFYYYSPFEAPVFEPNKAPTIDAISNQNLGIETKTVNLSGISDGDNKGQIITITANSNNELVATASVNYSDGAGGTLSISGISPGTATISVTVKDNGGTEQGGIDNKVITFTITVAETISAKKIAKEEISVKPNPASNYITISTNNISVVEIVSLTGNTIKTYCGTNNFDISELANGVYIIKVTTNDQKVGLTRFVKN